jgi:F-type H+-transporting ATPase subunit b
VLTSATAHVTTTTATPNFLIPNGTFVVELILFLIVFGIVATVILPPITGAMKERADKVRSALNASDEGQAEADRLVAERQQVLDGARAEARSLLEAAGASSEALFEEGRTKGQAEHDRVLAEARPQLDAERRGVEEELMGKMGELVGAAAAQVVRTPLDADQHRRIIDEAVARVTSAAVPAIPENGA